MRLITLALAALLLLIQYPLWLGKGGWLRVADMEAQVAVANKKNMELKARNDKLESEVRDLKDGTGAVEERARYELGMVKQNEIFVHRAQGPNPAACISRLHRCAALSIPTPASLDRLPGCCVKLISFTVCCCYCCYCCLELCLACHDQVKVDASDGDGKNDQARFDNHHHISL